MTRHSQASPGQSGAVRPLLAAASLVLLTAALALVLFTALRSPLKDDIAWLLYVARRWLAGRELYVDLVEVNPPLIIWLSAIPVRLAGWSGISSQTAAVLCVITSLLGSAWWTAVLLRRQGGALFAQPLPVFAAISIVLLLVPGAELGQREHLLAAAILPYVAIFAGELDGVPPRLRSALLAGVLAGLGCALKPRYAAVFVVLECLALLRGLRPWRWLPLSAIGAMAAYGAAIAVFCPAYLSRAVPLALALYDFNNTPLLALAADCTRILFGQAVAAVLLWLAWRRMPERRLMLVLVTVAVTSILVCFMDDKNWFYHRLPAIIPTVLALLLWAASTGFHRGVAVRRLLLPGALAGLALAMFSVAAGQRLAPQVALAMAPQQTAVDRLEAIIHQQHAHSYVAFSEWIALGFPVVNQTGVTWASRFDSMWALKAELWRARFDPKAAKDWPVLRWVVHDFITTCPDIAVADVRGVNYVDVLKDGSEAFARAWSHYRPIATFDGLVVYRRSASGCVNPWVAAARAGRAAN